MNRQSTTQDWRRYLSIHFVVEKVRNKGLAWCAQRAILYLWSITERSARRTAATISHLAANIRYTDQIRKQAAVLYAFYDLAVSPVTFDILVFLILAEAERIRNNCRFVHVIIVPGYAKYEGYRKGFLQSIRNTSPKNHDLDFLGWRIRNILVPCCWLLPSMRNVAMCVNRDEAKAILNIMARNIFPPNYSIHAPIENYGWKHLVYTFQKLKEFPSLESTPQSFEYVREWIKENVSPPRRLITITLRESSYELPRNSNLEEWGKFVSSLNMSLYFPIIIRDTEATFKPLPTSLDRIPIFRDVSWNLELRSALYELSFLNLMINGGPAILCYLNRKVRYLVFKMITLGPYATTPEHFKRIGMVPGEQLPMANEFQRLVWDEDTFEVISREFKIMCGKIESTFEKKSLNDTGI